ncbi:amidohydrolase family protein [Leifsonia sp. L25]|uniref:amidohydrolase family protein n=1 Tax=Leifsonia sp. L25 TaxID=3423957 RepID=UPI003D698B89
MTVSLSCSTTSAARSPTTPTRRAGSEACALAALPNVAAKVSGLTSGLTPGRWTADDLRGIVDTAVEAFGPDRLLYGSDWPLAELGGGAPAWREAFDALVAGLSTSERDAMLGGNAARVYSVG